MPESLYTQNEEISCLNCGATPTVRSHLLPEAFVKEILIDAKSNEKHMLRHPTSGFKQPSNRGRFETGLLCGTCDSLLGKNENYAFLLLKELRKISSLSKEVIEFGNIDGNKLVRFAAGVIWKYASVPPDHPSKITIGPYSHILKEVAFGNLEIPPCVDAFLMRDLLSVRTFSDPSDVYYYNTPSLGRIGSNYKIRASCFSVGGFIVHVKIDKRSAKSIIPQKCWLRNTSQGCFLVTEESMTINAEILESVSELRLDLQALNRKLPTPRI